MAGSVGAPQISTNDLVFIIDPSNKETYTSGSVFNTISDRYSYQGTMYNGITFSQEGNGSFLYDGTNEHAAISSTDADNFHQLLTNNFTAMIWCKPSAIAFIASRIFGLGYLKQWQFEIRGSSFNQFALNYRKSSTNYFVKGPSVDFDTWQQAGIVVSNGIIKFFVNGVITGGSHTIPNDGNFEEVSQPYSYGNYDTGTDGRYNGYLSHHAVYNRVLSGSEILQSYNSLKGRFGL